MSKLQRCNQKCAQCPASSAQATLWHLHEPEAPSALNCKSLVGSYSIDSFYFEQTSTDGFCNRVHYSKSGFVGLSGFENKAYWVCIYHLLLLFMASWKLAKFLAIYLDPWWVIFLVVFAFQVQVLLFSVEGCPIQSYTQKQPLCCTTMCNLLAFYKNQIFSYESLVTI